MVGAWRLPGCAPSTSLAGGIGPRSRWSGRGSWTKIPWTPGSAARRSMACSSSLWVVDAARSTATVVMPASAAAARLSRAKAWQRGLSPTTTVARQASRAPRPAAASSRMAAIISARRATPSMGSSKGGGEAVEAGGVGDGDADGVDQAEAGAVADEDAVGGQAVAEVAGGGDEDPRGVGGGDGVAVVAEEGGEVGPQAGDGRPARRGGRPGRGGRGRGRRPGRSPTTAVGGGGGGRRRRGWARRRSPPAGRGRRRPW